MSNKLFVGYSCNYLFIVTILLSFLFSAQAFAQTENGPNLCVEGDILEGHRTLLALDNLLLSNLESTPSASTTFSEFIFDMNVNVVFGTSSQNVFVNSNCSALPTDGAPFPFQQRFARLFETTNDFLVTVRMGAAKGCNQSLVVTAEDMVNNTKTTLNTTSSQNWIQSAVGDFNADGYDDLFIITDFEMIILTAQDTGDPGSGLVTAFRDTLGSLGLEGFVAMNEPTVYDLDRDGTQEVGLVGGGKGNGSQLSAYIMTVCDGLQLFGDCAGVDAFTPLSPIFITDLQATVNPGASEYSRYPAVAITAGTYGGTGGVVIVDSTSSRFTTELWQFGSGLSPIGPVLTNQSQSIVTNSVLAKSGRINWFGGSDQIILAFSGTEASSNGSSFVEVQVIDVVQFLDSIDWVINSNISNDVQNLTLTGLDTGTFTEIIRSVDGVTPIEEFNLKVAASFTSQNGSTRSVLKVFEFPNAEVSNFDFFLREQFTFSGLTTTLKTLRGGSMLQSGDSEGLGFILGEPLHMRVSQSQVTNVIQAPPRHTGYVDTGRLLNPVTLFNISANVSAYLASFNASETNTISSTTRSTTSYTDTTQESFRMQMTVRVLPFDQDQFFGFGGMTNPVWRQTYNRTVDRNFNTYSGVTNKLNVVDVPADYIQFSEKIMSYYMYPYIGYKACPEGNPDCSENEKLPVNLMISGPSNTVITVSNGRVNEFYQPVHEPVNILSYPNTEEQLRRQFNFTNAITSVNFDIVDNAVEIVAEWDEGTGQSESVETTNIDEFGFGFGVWQEKGKVSDDEKQGGRSRLTSFDFNLNQSDAVTKVNANTFTQQSSQGLRIKLPGTFADTTLYGYNATAFVFTEDTGELLQTIPRVSSEPLDNLNGRLQSAFIVSPQTVKNQLGSWWDDNWYTDYPDIALNRPAWMFLGTLLNADITQHPDFCIAVNTSDATNKLNCSFIYAPDTFATLWESPWYFMRGFFINVGGFDGPVRSYANLGEEVFLSFRVHNYSLYQYSQTDLSQIKGRARLYAQEWNPHNGQNIPVPGVPSELIDEFTFDPIPRSQDYSGADNWILLTSDKFGTEGRAGKSYIFWVIVWMERDLGNGEVELVQEVPFHGLEQIPGDLKGIRESEEIIEWLEVNACWIAGNSNVPCTQDPITGEPEFKALSSFTNNVAFYKMPFHVIGAEDIVEEDPCVEELSAGSRLEFRNAALMPESVIEGESVRVTAEVHTMGWEPNLGESVSVHEGTADEMGPAIEFEHLGLIRGDQHRLIDFHFIPTGCGEKVITLLNDRGLVSEAYAAMDLYVECRAPLNSGGNGGCALAAPKESPSGAVLLFSALIMLVPIRRLIKYKNILKMIDRKNNHI